MFLIVPGLLGRPARRVVMLGNAGGTTGRAFGVFFPDVRYDGVEIDPQVTTVARRYFGLGDNPNLVVHTADARPFLATSGARYDAIFIDAYRQPYVPFYLATREFFELARRHLAPDGVIALNISTTPDDHALADDIAGTLASVFPQVEYWQALRFNALVVGFASPVPAADQASRLSSLPADLRVLGRLYARQVRPVAALERPWTDDRAPRDTPSKSSSCPPLPADRRRQAPPRRGLTRLVVAALARAAALPGVADSRLCALSPCVIGV
jgi:hypothetical protein